MARILKFQVKCPIGSSEFKLELPVGAEFRHVDTQHELPTMWFEAELLSQETRTFAIYATGEEFTPEGKKYLGTFLLNAGQFVFHLYEII